MKGRKPFIFDAIDRLFRSGGAILLNKAEKKLFPLQIKALLLTTKRLSKMFFDSLNLII